MRDSGITGKYNSLINLLFFAFFLYLFFASIELMEIAFKGVGKGFAEQLIKTTSSPFVGLFVGILATSIMQSSSLTTSMLVGMVSSGIMTITNAIPIVMGANIGTTVTNTIVAMTSATRKQEFGKAFASAIVHDFFNILTMLILMPLHLITQSILGKGILQILAEGLASIFEYAGGLKFASPLQMITEPLIRLLYDIIFPTILSPFGQSRGLGLAIFTFIFALALLFLSLTYMSKTMKSAIMVKLENLLDTYLFKTAIRSFILGMLITAIIQSSSITTSLVVPLVGIGILTLEQIFPYTLGANIGTTITAILASLAVGSYIGITVAFAHLFYNILGTIIWYPLRIVPITIAKKMAQLSEKHKKIALIYMITTFYVIPGLLILFTR
ncbi:MAG: Na/Pi symporter [Candidatus Poribacteria bacterium]